MLNLQFAMRNMNIWVVIPAYNEAQRLKGLLDQLQDKALSVLVIDDGSRDDTFEVVKQRAHLVIKNKRNMGKGMALKKAINHLRERDGVDYIITMDADGQHSPSDIDSFLREAADGQPFVVGNRMHNPLGMPRIRIITNRIMSWLISKLVRQQIPDTQCGFRLIKREVLDKIKIESNKFEIESEILIKAAREKFRIKSIPIKSIYFKNQRSKIRPLRDTIRFLKFIFSLSDRDER